MEVGGCRLMCEGDYFNKEWAWSLGQAAPRSRLFLRRLSVWDREACHDRARAAAGSARNSIAEV